MAKRTYPQHDDETYRRYFARHVRIDEVTNCQLWQGGKNNLGYGMFRYKDGMATAHRVRMQLEGYDIKGKKVYHTCDNYNCVNPAHLKIGDIFDVRGLQSSRGRAGRYWSDPKYKLTCTHCGKTSRPQDIDHYHNDKCKSKPNISTDPQ
jgi:hypothetical protein